MNVRFQSDQWTLDPSILLALIETKGKKSVPDPVIPILALAVCSR